MIQNYLSTTIESIHSSNKLVYLMGDFNIDLLKKDVHNISEHFSNMLHSFNFFPLINSPTRVTETSSTLIDNIFTNYLSEHTSGVICSDLSDHYPIFTIINKHEHINETDSKNQKCFVFSQQNLSKLRLFFGNFDWCHITDMSEANEAWEAFLNIFETKLNEFCLISKNKTKKIKQKWMSYGLLKSSNIKNKLYKIYKKKIQIL